MRNIRYRVRFNIKRASLFCALILGLICSSAIAQPESDAWSFWDEVNEDNDRQVSHQLWGDFLFEYLEDDHPSGVSLFNYEEVDEDTAQKLKQYISSLTKIDPRSLNKNEQFAYWVNLYNALTVDVVLDNYPIESIKDIKEHFFSFFGPWDIELVEIFGQAISLNDIEHRILRPIWGDHRIHFAVNCASFGCPSLQLEPFLAPKLEEQLNNAAAEYLEHPRAVSFDGDTLVLSEVFNWYQVDFGANEKEAIETLSQYLPPPQSEQLKNHNGPIEYQYNWQLNEP